MFLKGLNLNEISKIKAIQRAIRVVADGSFGSYTLDIMYRTFARPTEPYLLNAYGSYIIIGRPESVNIISSELKGTKRYKNAISGTFSTLEEGGKSGEPSSITINNGKVVRAWSCHIDDKKPESVLFYDGKKVGVEREQYASSLMAKHPNIKWAIGGLGLVKDGDYKYFNDEAEGFVGRFGDVVRYTSHTVIYEDKWGYIGLMFVKNKNTYQIINILKNLGVKNAVQLDGGHLGSINADGYRYNTSQKQLSVIQMKGCE